MKIFVNILLGLGAVLCAAGLLLQSFLFPALPDWADLLLRIGGAMLLQLLMLRLIKKKLVRYLPLMLSAAAASWGFFLLLTSPSWRGATTYDFLQDYASFLGGCLIVCIFAAVLPQIKKNLKKLRKQLRRRRKMKKNKDIPHS